MSAPKIREAGRVHLVDPAPIRELIAAWLASQPSIPESEAVP